MTLMCACRMWGPGPAQVHEDIHDVVDRCRRVERSSDVPRVELAQRRCPASRLLRIPVGIAGPRGVSLDDVGLDAFTGDQRRSRLPLAVGSRIRWAPVTRQELASTGATVIRGLWECSSSVARSVHHTPASSGTFGRVAAGTLAENVLFPISRGFIAAIRFNPAGAGEAARD
jgi:hypothetical protein